MPRYTQRPEPVEVFTHAQGTDIFLRRCITETADPETGQALWDCEEASGRVAEAVTAEEVEADFDGWWEMLLEQLGQEHHRPTLEEQLEQLRADVDFLLWQEEV